MPNQCQEPPVPDPQDRRFRFAVLESAQAFDIDQRRPWTGRLCGFRGDLQPIASNCTSGLSENAETRGHNRPMHAYAPISAFVLTVWDIAQNHGAWTRAVVSAFRDAAPALGVW
jgi:hypothetical protein